MRTSFTRWRTLRNIMPQSPEPFDYSVLRVAVSPFHRVQLGRDSRLADPVTFRAVNASIATFETNPTTSHLPVIERFSRYLATPHSQWDASQVSVSVFQASI